MPGWSGIEVLGRVIHHPYVVFTTAYAQHAVTAFELGALDYLLKPFGPAAFDRLREALSNGPMTRLFVRSGASVIPITVAGVAWFEARRDYVAAHVGLTRHLLHLSLNRLETRLDAARFLRIHRTHIVNLDWVSAFRREGKGLVAELSDGTRLAVSRNRSHGLRGLLKE